MPDIGNTLREARIRRGLSIADVEAITKIRGKYLEALEENDFEVIPGPTYVKGFLRTYALLLELDADALVSEYRSDYEPRTGNDTNSEPVRSVSQGRPRTARERRKPGRRRTQRGYILAGVVALLVVVLLAWFGSGRGQEAASLESENLNPPQTTTTLLPGSSGAAAVVSTTDGGAAASSSTTVRVATTTGANVVLVLNVTEGSCWLVVREDNENGAELFAGTLSAGGQQTFDGAKRYWIMAGKPEVLALTVNGTTYSLTPPAGSFVVTEAGVERSGEHGG